MNSYITASNTSVRIIFFLRRKTEFHWKKISSGQQNRVQVWRNILHPHQETSKNNLIVRKLEQYNTPKNII